MQNRQPRGTEFFRTVAFIILTSFVSATAFSEPTSATTSPATKPTASKSKSAPAKSPTSPPKTPPAPVVEKQPLILVTAATRDAQTIDTTATTTTAITRSQLDAAQYDTVASALTKVPGLTVVPQGAPGQSPTTVFIHGMDGNQTLFTIDGRRQPVGLSGAYDFANLTLDNVDQIEVVRTPSSTMDGGNAAGGVINLVTLSGRGLSQPISSASFEGGSYATYRENLQSRGAVGAFDYAVSGTNLSSDMNRPNENYRNTVYRGNFGYQATPDVYLDLHSGYSLSSAGSPNTIYTPDPIAHLQTQDWFVSPEITAKVTDFYTTKFYINYDQQSQTYTDNYTSPDGYSILPLGTHLQINTTSLDWQNNFQIAEHWKITAGIQGDNSYVNQYTNYNDYDYPPVTNATTLKNNLTNIGGYIESLWEPITGLNVISSVRDDAYSDYAGAVSWRQGVSYRVAPTQTLIHFSGSSAYTPPSLQQLYYPMYGNPNLKPETSLGWEAGVEQPLADGKVTPGATYFYNNITNYIQDDANFIPQNIGQATTEGAEVNIKAKPLDNLTLDLNYTYLTAVNDTNDVRLIRRPRNSFNFTGTWLPVPQLTLTLGGSWIVGRQDFDPVTFAQVDAPDYFVLRASATYRINRNVSIWVRGDNITNTQYQPVLGYPALNAAVFGGIKVTF